MEWTKDLGKTWERTETLNGGDTLSAIQPTVLKHPNGKLQILNRTKSNKIYSSWSVDNGETWTKLTPIDLPNNNSGIDAVTLKDGRHLLIYNHIDRSKKQGKRNQLHLAISTDGVNWSAVCMVENDKDIEHEYSYPAIIQTKDGLVHITYTWRRKLIKHVVVNPLKITSTPIVNGEWPKSVK
jgi:predicted neuraminidase